MSERNLLRTITNSILAGAMLAGSASPKALAGAETSDKKHPPQYPTFKEDYCVEMDKDFLVVKTSEGEPIWAHRVDPEDSSFTMTNGVLNIIRHSSGAKNGFVWRWEFEERDGDSFSGSIDCRNNTP